MVAAFVSGLAMGEKNLTTLFSTKGFHSSVTSVALGPSLKSHRELSVRKSPEALNSISVGCWSCVVSTINRRR
jgi:hypothetical protein